MCPPGLGYVTQTAINGVIRELVYGAQFTGKLPSIVWYHASLLRVEVPQDRRWRCCCRTSDVARYTMAGGDMTLRPGAQVWERGSVTVTIAKDGDSASNSRGADTAIWATYLVTINF